MSRTNSKCAFGTLLVISFCVSVVTVSGSKALAQAISGTVVGTVRDATGAVLPGANITATNTGTGISQSAISASAGDYTIPNLAPGTYKIAAQTKGFTTAVVQNSVVQVEQTTRVDFNLSPGQTTQQIEVTGEAPLVQSTTSDLGQVIESRQIEALRSMADCSSSL